MLGTNVLNKTKITIDIKIKEIIKAKIKKKFIAQSTINIADDDELLQLASEAGLIGVFIGFETITDQGLLELQKKFNIRKKYAYKSSVYKIKKHGIIVLGSFIIGLDMDKKNIGLNIAKTCINYGIDILNLVLLTPLPGTRLWNKYLSENRIIANNYPDDWKYYTLTLPVAEYRNLSWIEMLNELSSCFRLFYSYHRIFKRFFNQLIINRKLYSSITGIIANLNFKHNISEEKKVFKKLIFSRGARQTAGLI